MRPDDFDLTCVPLRGTLSPLASFLGYGDIVRVDDRPGNGSYWGKLRPAQGGERQPAPEEGMFWMAVAPGQFWDHALIRRGHLDAVDLTASPSAMAAVLAAMSRWRGLDVGVDDLLDVLKQLDIPWVRVAWRRHPANNWSDPS